MFSAIRRRMRVSPMTVIASLALVFAMTGGAYAAKRYLITSTRQISPSVLRSLQGKAGPAGANGAQGSAGAQGAAGPGGPQGPVGAQGKEGSPGKNGENGKDGTTGFTETLPKGKTLKGEWSLASPEVSAANKQIVSSVSFGIPLAKAPLPHYIRSGGTTPAGCTGNVEEPGAEEGNLCVFAKDELNTQTELPPFTFPNVCAMSQGVCTFTPAGADKSGFGLVTLSKEAGFVTLDGTWAVTAE